MSYIVYVEHSIIYVLIKASYSSEIYQSHFVENCSFVFGMVWF
jgi:hypothetical protein